MSFGRFLNVLPSVVSSVALSLLSGCGDVEIPALQETQLVEAVVTSVGDAAGDEAAFQSVFVNGSAPDNRGRYFSAAITMVGEPQIDGDQAVATVKVTQGNAESEGRGGVKSGKVVDGEVTWTLKKVSGEWKLQDAPLPEV